MKIQLIHTTGVVKKATVGFSWTICLFGGWPYVFRGMWGELFKMWLLAVPTLGIYTIIQWFTGNKKTIIRLMEKGYSPSTEEDAAELRKRGIIA